MDAQPYRPRGAENAAPMLHQRHKSTGTLAAIASNASTAGFRGPAKRAAFGDVTNLVKQVGTGREDRKVTKMLSAAQLGLAQGLGGKNKENVNINTNRTLQRAATFTKQTNKGKAFGDKAWEPLKVSERTDVRDAAPQVSEEIVLSSSNVVNVSKQSMAPQPLTIDSVPVQPRHHKSQQQLKQQQPKLRRTQSRQLERTDVSAVLSIDKGMMAVALPEDEEFVVDELDLNVEIGYGDEVSEEKEWMESPTTLPDIADEYKDHEEYEEEDDYGYDDQEQAGLTAHSLGGITTVLQPLVSQQVQIELNKASLLVEATRPAEDIEDEAWDVSMVAEYGDDIFQYMRELEISMQPDPYYMDRQTDIQWSMRSVLMDWLVQVHNRFTLLPETLFLTVNYVDRFLSKKVVSMSKLQLVGATAILLASKYEEINCPSLQEIVYMVDNGYSGEEILKAERFMLSMLGFELGWPGPMSFLRRVSKADDYDLETRTLAKYFLELTIMDERFVATPPSFLAAGAHCLSRLILGKGDWTPLHVHYSGYTWGQLRSLVTMMIGCCEMPHLHHAAIFDKYSDRRFKHAARIVQDVLDAGFTFPGQRLPVRSRRNHENVYIH